MLFQEYHAKHVPAAHPRSGCQGDVQCVYVSHAHLRAPGLPADGCDALSSLHDVFRLLPLPHICDVLQRILHGGAFLGLAAEVSVLLAADVPVCLPGVASLARLGGDCGFTAVGARRMGYIDTLCVCLLLYALCCKHDDDGSRG